ncbi:MAG: carboxylesterase family protein [Synergistaceae bacterium]|nr:carboxylesterase family protein [Candidatus Equadaptatus faecalis]
MRKLFSFDDIIVAFVSAIGYGVGFCVPDAYGAKTIFSGIVSIIAGDVLFVAADKLVARKYFQVVPRRKKLLFAAVVVCFLISYALCMKLWGYSIYHNLAEMLEFVVGFPIIVLAVSFAVRTYKTKKMRAEYGDGTEGVTLDEDEIASIKDTCGENSAITGEYDESCAVKTRTGVFVGKERKKVRAFLGIPYARAERWKAPQPLESSDAVFEAYYFGSSAVQPQSNRNYAGYLPQSEDCLTLNVWTAAGKSEKKCPVLVYIHGGDFACGSSAVPLYHGRDFVRRHKDVLFVSLNYRLGLLGFANFAGISGAEEYPDSQNLGLLDQIEALKWIKENIAAFGGDPDNITVAGEHAGGVSALLLGVIKQAEGLFDKIFVLAGNFESLYTPEQQNELCLKFAKAAGAENMEQLLALAPEQILDAQKALGSDVTMPVCDGIVPSSPYREIADGAAKNINILAGMAENEFGSWVSSMGEADSAEMITFYLKAAIEDDSKRGRLLKKLYEEQLEQGAAEEDALECIFSRFGCEAGLLLTCRLQSKAGGAARCFRWKAGSPIEKFGASSYACLFHLLGNSEYAEKCGYLCRSDLEETLQACLVNFMKKGNPSLYQHEVKNVGEIKWQTFAKKEAVMEFTEDSAEYGAEDIIEYCRKFDEILLNG